MLDILRQAATLRSSADALAAQIASKRDPVTASELARVQRLLRAMADMLDADELDPFLLQVRTRAQVKELLRWDEMPSPGSESFKQLAAAGLDASSFPLAKAALLALVDPAVSRGVDTPEVAREEAAHLRPLALPSRQGSVRQPQVQT